MGRYTTRKTLKKFCAQAGITLYAHKLEAKKATGEDMKDVNRELTAADLTTKDLKAGVAIDFSKKFNAAFASNGTFKRVGEKAEVADTPTTPGAGGDQKPPTEIES